MNCQAQRIWRQIEEGKKLIKQIVERKIGKSNEVQKKTAEGKWQGREEEEERKRENGRIEVVANIVSLTCAFPALHLGISHLTKSGKNANFSQELKNKGKPNQHIKKKTKSVKWLIDLYLMKQHIWLCIINIISLNCAFLLRQKPVLLEK